MKKENINAGKIIKVSGPLVVASGMQQARMYEVVKVSNEKLIGEIIGLNRDEASIQVYENTSGIGPGEPVYLTGKSLSVELGPGLIGSIYDGIQRPLDLIYEKSGDYIPRGVEVPGINREKKWKFTPRIKVNDVVGPGDILGDVQETALVKHKILVPFDVEGTVLDIKEGDFTIEEPVAVIETSQGKKEIKMLQVWSIRQPRPVSKKINPSQLLITGQRVIDAFFPIAKGGTACIPGPFGSGKTIVQHQLAKWADADIIIFIGCGERGNEMTDVLREFPELKDPRTGQPLMKRTVLIANTSNMPVAAREASVYTGITIGEYFRDMGYNVALMADSTSRWAEAMREISGRLEEMPGEEGYPAYLGSRTAAFYERAGKVICLGKEGREGSLTVVGAVSPPGGDLSEPVTQNTLRTTKVFWGLDSKLANARHFPAINWLTSYSLYSGQLEDFMRKDAGPEWPEMRKSAMEILQKEDELKSIVQLVGVEALSQKEQLLLNTAQSIKEDFLHQNAFDEIDTFTSLKKMFWMLKAILTFHKKGLELLQNGIDLKGLISLPVKEKISHIKLAPENELNKLEDLVKEIEHEQRI
ncbi:MAG: V-type ATP synthase subunit A [Candidatus Nealsonbacteria bacterium]